MNAEGKLVAHWKFGSDFQDAAGHNHPDRIDHVGLGEKGPQGRAHTAARFNGKDSRIEVRGGKSLNFGAGDFTIAVWICTEQSSGDVVGDLVCKYDPAARNGINLGVVSHAGVVGSQANYRNVHFGIDAGRQEAAWTDCGRPGNSLKICALAVHQGGLYAGTFEPGAHEQGYVYRYEGGRKWADCGSPSPANSIMSLAVFEEQLYCAAGRYKAWGSGLPDSPNHAAGGHVYRYRGGRKWDDCGRLAAPVRADLGKPSPTAYAEAGSRVTAASNLTVYQGRLYAGAPWHWGVYEYAGHRRWKFIGPRRRLIALTVYQNALHAICNDGGEVMRYEGDSQWQSCGRPEQTGQSYAAAVYEGRLHISTWPAGMVFRQEATGEWAKLGRVGYNMEVMGMNVYNGKLYAGVLPMGDVHRLDGNRQWTWMGNLDRSQAPLRRVWSLCVHRGRLFGGTLPSGHVYSFQAGAMATHDQPLKTGWQHIAAVREGEHLRLYINGKPAASSPRFPRSHFHLSNDRPLVIGFGQSTYFRGLMSDLRIYRRALAAGEVCRLALPTRTEP